MTTSHARLQSEFSLVVEGDVGMYADALALVGCHAQAGSVGQVEYLTFEQRPDASDFEESVSRAIAAVEAVGGLRVRRVEPDDLVTAAEIADRLGRSRESIRLLVSGARGDGDFPAPVSHLRERQRLWRWSEVAAWSGAIDAEEERRATFVAAVNAALELRSYLGELDQLAYSLLGKLPVFTRDSEADAVRPRATIRGVDGNQHRGRGGLPHGGEPATPEAADVGPDPVEPVLGGLVAVPSPANAAPSAPGKGSYWDRARAARHRTPISVTVAALPVHSDNR